jgi:hypothetical protein
LLSVCSFESIDGGILKAYNKGVLTRATIKASILPDKHRLGNLLSAVGSQ